MLRSEEAYLLLLKNVDLMPLIESTNYSSADDRKRFGLQVL